MQLLFLSAAIVLGYEIIHLLDFGHYFGDLKYTVLNSAILGLVLLIFILDFKKTKFMSIIAKYADGLTRLGIAALLQAIVVLIIFIIRSI